MGGTPPEDDTGPESRRLFVYSGGFLTQPRIRRILTLAGYDISIGKPTGKADRIGVWGRSPTAPRGEAVSGWTETPVVRVEDAFLRSIRPGRESGEPPLGLLIDELGVHFDSSVPSQLEHLLTTAPLDDGAVLQRARDGIDRLKASHLSKYNNFDPDLDVPKPGYVLVLDQTRGDASVEYGQASASTFREMLVFAQEEHPGARVVIKSHPETVLGQRPGYFTDEHALGHITLLREPVSPWKLMEGAVGVYTVSSQLGFEAIMAGHKPRVFGQPFYAGWGLTDDENPVARRERKLSRAQLFAAAMILAPRWYDPCRDRLCSFEEAVDQLEAQARAFRDDHCGHVAVGMRLWKRRYLQQTFGGEKRLVFKDDPQNAAVRAKDDGRRILVWAGKETDSLRDASLDLEVLRVEDGFIRSRGLGAELVPPLSLVTDRSGIYYDPNRVSDLERHIASGPPPGGEIRAERLMARLIQAGLSKYNPGESPAVTIPDGHKILVAGQVADDASIRLGAGAEKTDEALLSRVRAENPGSVLVYKPHPDVVAGLREGRMPKADALNYADVVVGNADPAVLIGLVDEVWTITSLLGFEALIRGKPVTCLGTPFYSGWGLTRDLGPIPERRTARPTLPALVHATLIAYPRYRDPVSGLPCSAEVIVDRLAHRDIPLPGRGNRLLSKLQGLFASQSWLWR